MPSQRTDRSNPSYVYTQINELISKFGPQRVSQILSVVSTKAENQHRVDLLNHIASVYFNVTLLELQKGTAHTYASMRGVCFYVLKQKNISLRDIGDMYGLTQHSVHKYVKYMELVCARPQTDKSMHAAYVSISNSFFSTLSITAPDLKLDQMADQMDGQKINQKIIDAVREQIRITNSSVLLYSQQVGINRHKIERLLAGKGSLKAEDIVKIERFSNIKLL